MRKVVLVTGPPCVGKSSYVAQHAAPGDLVLDQDALGLAEMRRRLAEVAAMPSGAAWVIRCCPGPAARAALAEHLRAELVHLVLPPKELFRRTVGRLNPRRHVQAIRQWFIDEAAAPAVPVKGFVSAHDW